MSVAENPDKGASEERTLAVERRARAAAELHADRMQRLARVATALSFAATVKQVAEVIVKEAKAAIGADFGGVWMLDEGGTSLRLLTSAPELPPGSAETYASYPLTTDNPLCTAVRQGEPLWIESWDDYTQRFPASEARVHDINHPRPVAFGCLPLRFELETLGGLAFSFFRPQHFDERDRAFVELLAHHCAQGLERARLYERALEAIRVRDDFLSIAGHELRTPLGTLVLQVDYMLAASRGGARGGRAHPADVADGAPPDQASRRAAGRVSHPRRPLSVSSESRPSCPRWCATSPPAPRRGRSPPARAALRDRGAHRRALGSLSPRAGDHQPGGERLQVRRRARRSRSR